MGDFSVKCVHGDFAAYCPLCLANKIEEAIYRRPNVGEIIMGAEGVVIDALRSYQDRGKLLAFVSRVVTLFESYPRSGLTLDMDKAQLLDDARTVLSSMGGGNRDDANVAKSEGLKPNAPPPTNSRDGDEHL